MNIFTSYTEIIKENIAQNYRKKNINTNLKFQLHFDSEFQFYVTLVETLDRNALF